MCSDNYDCTKYCRFLAPPLLSVNSAEGWGWYPCFSVKSVSREYVPIHTDIFISRYIISIFIFQKIAIINTLYVKQNNLCHYHGMHILPTIYFMKRDFHGNHINLQTMYFHSICERVWGQVYLVTFCICFTYLLYFKSSIMLAYDFFRHICQKDVTIETFNL